MRAGAYVVTKREPVKYCTCISVGRLTVGNRDTYVSWPPPMRSNAVGGGGGIAWLGLCNYDASTGLPPGLEVGGLEV